MSRELSDKEIGRYREELAKLPIGSISRKTIAGKVRYYRQWAEDGRTRSEYLKESEVEGMRRKIERRMELDAIGREIDAMFYGRMVVRCVQKALWRAVGWVARMVQLLRK